MCKWFYHKSPKESSGWSRMASQLTSSVLEDIHSCALFDINVSSTYLNVFFHRCLENYNNCSVIKKVALVNNYRFTSVSTNISKQLGILIFIIVACLACI